MRLFTLAVTCVTCLLVGFSVFTGCSGGSDGLFDEEATKYNAVFYAFNDDGEDSSRDIDVFQTLDCDGDGVFDDPEPYFDFHAEVVITTDATAAEFRVESYTVNLRANHGAYFDGANWNDLAAGGMPGLTGTALNPVDYNFGSPVIGADSSVTIDLLIWSPGDKEAYADIVEALGLAASVTDTVFAYDVQVVLHCRYLDDETFQITTAWSPVNFGPYNSCE